MHTHKKNYLVPGTYFTHFFTINNNNYLVLFAMAPRNTIYFCFTHVSRTIPYAIPRAI